MHVRPSILALAVVLAAGATLLVPLASSGRTSGASVSSMSMSMPMSDGAMRDMARAYWASHPARGTSSRAVAAATFSVTNYQFDADGNLATQVDTVHINAGESVTWTYVTGFHTVTSGNPSDIDAGSLFNQPMDTGHTADFTYTFATAGTYPFFCVYHAPFNMLGVVVVQNPASVPPATPGSLGFVAEPAPNPTRGGVAFRFALREPGRARLEIFDTRGRRVAVALDRDLDAGVHDAAWDGRMAGARGAPGVYYARLTLPGFASSRRIVLSR